MLQLSASFKIGLQRNWPRDVEFWRGHADDYKELQRKELLEMRELELVAADDILVHGHLDPTLQLQLTELEDSLFFVTGMVNWLGDEGEALCLLRMICMHDNVEALLMCKSCYVRVVVMIIKLVL